MTEALGGEEGVSERRPCWWPAGAITQGHPPGICPSHHYCGFGRKWCSIRAALAIILWGSSKDMRPDMSERALAWPRGQLKCS